MNQIDYEINKELGECYLFMGEYGRARDYYRKAAENNPDVSDPYMGLAAVALNEGDLNAALLLYRKAALVQPGPKPFTGVAMVEAELGLHNEAYESYAKALSYESGNMFVLNNILQLAYVLGRIEELIPYLEAGLESGDTEAVRYALAGCLTTLGRDEEAKQHLEILLRDNPTNGVAQQLYAQFAA